jgi:hypothetical protein
VDWGAQGGVLKFDTVSVRSHEAFPHPRGPYVALYVMTVAGTKIATCSGEEGELEVGEGGWRARDTWRVQWLALELEQDLFLAGAQRTNHRFGRTRNETPSAHNINAREFSYVIKVQRVTVV